MLTRYYWRNDLCFIISSNNLNLKKNNRNLKFKNKLLISFVNKYISLDVYLFSVRFVDNDVRKTILSNVFKYKPRHFQISLNDID